MKKVHYVTLVVLLFVSLVLPLQVRAGEKVDNIVQEWINEEGVYDFPINLSSAEWNDLGTRENMLSATQIPEALLEDMETSDLIKLVLKYPLLSEIHLYENNLEGYNALKENFNGICELLSRDNAYSELLKFYIEYEIPTERIIDYSDIIEREDFADIYNQMLKNDETRELMLADCDVYNTIDVLEMMLLELSQNRKTRSSEENFWEAYSNKLLEKEQSDYYKNVASGSLVADLLDDETQNNEVVATAVSSVGITVNGNGTCTLSIPGSGTVVCTYVTTFSYLDPSEYTAIVTAYNASLISKASTTFNCHSFAWLQNSLSAHYQYIWLDTATQFMASSYYSKESTPTATGRVASWSAHSALVTEVSKSNPYNNGIPEPYCVSKWGAGPIVAHYLSLCPYYSSGSGVQYYY